MAEFAVEVEIASSGASVEVGLPGPQFRRPGGPLSIGPTKFPLYPLNDPADIPILTTRFFEDFNDAMGIEVDCEQCWFEVEGWPNREGAHGEV